MDGPYGSLGINLGAQRVLVLVAGGVGVTPMLSIAEAMLAAQPGDARPHVHFVWMTRGTEPMSAWAGPQLSAMAKVPHFSLHLYDTRASAASSVMLDAEASCPVAPGRARLAEFDLVALARAHYNQAALQTDPLRSDAVAMFACGPKQMVADTHAAAKANGYHMHAETFEW